MIRKRKVSCILIWFLFLLSPVSGNNVRIVGVVRTPAEQISNNIATVEFTLEWENSWRDDYNHDAVYLSLRYKLLRGAGTWYPVYLQDGGHSATNGFVYSMAPGHSSGRNVGVFIYAGSSRSGIARTTVSLKWDLGTTSGNGSDGLESGDFALGDVIIACTGIEMVYIPRGAYALGDYVGTRTSSSDWGFRHRDFYIPDSLDLVSTRYRILTNPDGVPTNPPELAANHINDISSATSDGSVTNAWMGTGSESTLLWTIDFGTLSDGTEIPTASAQRRMVEYISLESVPGRVPSKWELRGANDNAPGGWELLYTGTSSDWNTSLERVYPGQTAVRIPVPRTLRYYRIIVNKSDMPSGKTPVLKTVSMADTSLTRLFDRTFIVDSVATRLGGVTGLYAEDGESSWGTATIGSTYPNGYNGFYVMKYEVSQDQYCGFLQLLSPSDQKSRTIGSALDGIDVTGDRYVFGSDHTRPNWRNSIVISTRSKTSDSVSFACDLDPNTPVSLDGDGLPLGCNYLTPLDMLSYASWVGLRPLTELEYERMSRAPYPYVPLALECSWGGVDAVAPSGLQDGGKTNERFGSGNVNFDNRLGGPSRVGIFAVSGNRQSASGSSFWGVQDLSGNLSEIYYNISTTGRKFNGTKHGNGVHESLSTLHKSTWGWDTTSSSFGLRGGHFRSTMSSELSVSNRRRAVRHILRNDFRDSTVTFRLGRSVPEGPRLSSILTLENGRTTASGSVSDTVCHGVDYRIRGNSPSGNYALYFLWYKSENKGKTWELLKGETGSDLVLRDLTNSGMRAGVLHEYWLKRKAIRDNSDGTSSVVKIVVVNPSYTISRLRDTIDGYGKGAGITVETRYPTVFEWRYLSTGALLPSRSDNTSHSYYLPDKSDLTDNTGKSLHGKKTVMVTMKISDACERSEIVEVDVVNTLDKDLMKVKDNGSYRAWSDGTFAPSCEGYRRPVGGYEYRGDIGNGVYRIDPDGRHGPVKPFDVYCDMVTDGGGWTLAMTGAPGSTVFNYASAYWTNNTLLNEKQFDPEAKENMKNAAYLYCPVQSVWAQMTIDANGRNMDFKENINRENCKTLFSTTTYSNKINITTAITAYNLDGLLGGAWQRGNPKSGFNVVGGGNARYGIKANQTGENGGSNAETHDSTVGIGLTTYGAGAYASHGNTAAISTNRSGYFRIWIK